MARSEPRSPSGSRDHAWCVELDAQLRALEHCLLRAGFFHRAQLLVELRAQRRAPTLRSLLAEPETAEAIGQASGVRSLAGLCAASRACARSLRVAVPAAVVIRRTSHESSQLAPADHARAVGASAARATRGAATPATFSCGGPARAPTGALGALLASIWQDLGLEEALAGAMGGNLVRRCRTLSWACHECLRSAIPAESGPRPLAVRSAATGTCVLPAALRAGAVNQRSTNRGFYLSWQSLWQISRLRHAFNVAMGAAEARKCNVVFRSGCRGIQKLTPTMSGYMGPEEASVRPACKGRPTPQMPQSMELPMQHCGADESPAMLQGPTEPCTQPVQQSPSHLAVPCAAWCSLSADQVGAKRGAAYMLDDLRQAPDWPNSTSFECGQLVIVRLRGAAGSVGCLLHQDLCSGHWHAMLLSGDAVRLHPADIVPVEPSSPRTREALSLVLPRPVRRRRLTTWLGLALRSPTARAPGSRAAAACGPEAPCAARGAGSPRLYAFGSDLAVAEIFDISRGQWSVLPGVLEERSQAATAVLDGCLYAVGGERCQEPLTSVESFDPTVGAWQPMSELSVPRSGALLAVLTGCLYACGGSHGPGPLSSVERFDPARQDWQTLPSMVEARREASGVLAAGKLCVCGGNRKAPGFTSESAELFDPATGIWRLLPPMPEGRAGAAWAFLDGALYACGGLRTEELLRTAVKYKLDAGTWEDLPAMRQGRCFAAVAAASGRIHVCGGVGLGLVTEPQETWRALASAESFEPETGWTALPPMLEPRAYALVAVAAGQLYVCGGLNRRGGEVGLLASAERLGRRARSWEGLPPMGAPRACGSGALLAAA